MRLCFTSVIVPLSEIKSTMKQITFEVCNLKHCKKKRSFSVLGKTNLFDSGRGELLKSITLLKRKVQH